MAKKIGKQNKEKLAVSLGRIARSAIRGIGALLEFAIDLEKEGKSEYRECGRIKGKTKSGKEIKGAYGFRVKVGLKPEEFKGQKKLNRGTK